MENYLDNILGKLMTTQYLDLLDIIVVDDGSKDNTAKVANKIAKKAPNSIRDQAAWRTAYKTRPR